MEKESSAKPEHSKYWLQTPIDNGSLTIFRVAFGLLVPTTCSRTSNADTSACSIRSAIGHAVHVGEHPSTSNERSRHA
jgi:hypothetical protein